jgi:hypothetical protein
MKKTLLSLVVFLGLISISQSLFAVNVVCSNATDTYTDFCGGFSCSYYHDASYDDGTLPIQSKAGGVLTIVWPHAGTGKVAVWVDPLGGTQTIITFNVTVTDCLSIVSMPTFLCSGNSKSFSISDTNASTSYTWTAPSGWTINGGTNTLTTTSTSVTIVVSNPSTHGYNPITVSSNNSGTRTFNVWIGAPGGPTVYESGQPNANPVNLSKSTSYTFYAQAVGATDYGWTLPSGFSFSVLGVTHGSPVYITMASIGGTFSIRVKPTNTCGSSLAFLQVILPGTGEEGSRKASDDSETISDQTEPDNIKVDVPYPIPSRDHININLSQRSSIKLINLQGITVRDVTSEGQTIISTDDLSSGVYLLKVLNQKGVRQFKVSIQK